MLIWKRVAHFRKSRHIAEIRLSGDSLSFSGVIIGPRDGGTPGVLGISLDEFEEIVKLVEAVTNGDPKGQVPLIKEVTDVGSGRQD